MRECTQAARDHYEILGVTGRRTGRHQGRVPQACLAAPPGPEPRRPLEPRVRFKEINASYQVLSDPQRRAMYDRFGHRAEEPGSPFSSGGPFAGGVVDISDIAFDGILGDLLGVFGVGKGDKGDLKRDMEVSFEEAAFGCEKTMRYERVTPCGDCRGNGSAPGSVPETCSACNGQRARTLPAGDPPDRGRADLLAVPRVGRTS